MTIQLSPVAEAPAATPGPHFSANRLDLGALDGYIAPVVGFDHFRMSGPTFAPHPHAGFSAVSVLFEDSPGALHNRDSLGHDLIAGPGDIVWTQAGSGAIHEEVPERNGVMVHGLQLFVNLSARNKHAAPQAFHAKSATIPVVEQGHNRIRVVSGEFEGEASPVSPAERFDLLDASLRGSLSYTLDRGWNGLVYVLSGKVTVSTEGQDRILGPHQAVGMRGGDEVGTIRIAPQGEAHVLVLAGKDPKEPVATYGPFIMNSQAELVAAYERYRSGAMGRLA